MRPVVHDAPHYEFFQLVRLLRRQASEAEPPPADAMRQPWPEPVRFRSNISFSFMASDVQAVEPPGPNGGAPTVLVNFLGLASPGVKGSLPDCYAEFVLEEEARDDRDTAAAGATAPRRGNRAPRAFFDLFNDRLTALFYRAWAKNRLAIQYESGQSDRFVRVLFGLFGLGPPGVVDRLGVDVRALLAHAALLLRRPTTPAALTFLLTRYFGLPFEVQPFVPMRLPLAESEQLQMGMPGIRFGENTVLGSTCLLTQGKFRLRVGPLHWRQFTQLLPGEEGQEHPRMLTELVSLVRQAVGGEFEFDIQLLLRKRAVPKKMLLNQQHAARSRLGLSSWLGTRLAGGVAEDTICQTFLLEGSAS